MEEFIGKMLAILFLAFLTAVGFRRSELARRDVEIHKENIRTHKALMDSKYVDSPTYFKNEIENEKIDMVGSKASIYGWKAFAWFFALCTVIGIFQAIFGD